MSPIETLLVVLGAIVVAALMIRFVFPRMESRGVDVPALLESVRQAASTADRVLETVRPFIHLPDLLGQITAAAHVGVANAEQLWLTGQLEGAERKDAARQYIRDTLTLIGVEITPEVERVIDGAIEAEVLALGHNRGDGKELV